MKVELATESARGWAPAESDAELMARSGVDGEAFVGIFDRHYVAVHRYLQRRLGRDLADELAAETFLRAFAARQSFEPRSDSALPWLYGIASNLARHHHRTEKRRLRAYARVGSDLEAEQRDAATTASADAGGSGPALAAALASLGADEREALLLTAFAALTNDQAAAALGIPVGTLASRLHRARCRMLSALAGDDPRPKEAT
jgi:RNA polymerase sigma factor (sigma-70 family)